MLNRKKMPTIGTIRDIKMADYTTTLLPNGIPLHIYNAGTQPIVKIDIVFRGGRWLETKPATAAATIRLLTEGTTTRSAADIADYVDSYGGTLQTPDGLETTGVTLYCLHKHLEPLLVLVQDVLQNPVFPDTELDVYIQNSQHNLRIELDKNDTVAYRTATELLFGAAHPYGYNTSSEMYAALTRNDLIAYHQRNIVAEQAIIIASGNIDEAATALITKYLGTLRQANLMQTPTYTPPTTTDQKVVHLPKERSLQSAICVSRRLFGRTHPDYIEMTVLNTVFGGYFGSRLMANIREDKGYTYGIYSAIGKFRFDGYLMISAEVGKDVAADALHEIYCEMDRLCNELIGEDELEMVRNYSMGQYLHQFDGIFSTAGIIRERELLHLPPDFYSQLIAVTQTITAERLQQLAQKYLRRADFLEVVVG